MIYVKMLKPWGGFKVGDIVRFGETKGLAHIEAKDCIKVNKQQAVNEPIVAKPVEVATQPIVKEVATLSLKRKAKSKKK